jgi:ABC-2 type transport system permease protein
MIYFSVAWRAFRRYSTYRIATLAGAINNVVFGFITAFTYIALWHARPDAGGYDVTDALTYAWLAQAIGLVGALFGGGFRDELAERVRTGDISIDLYRPVDLQTWWLASDLGRAGFQLLARGLLPTLVGGLIFRITFPTNPVTWLAFLLAIFLGAVVCFSINYLFVLMTFWLMDSRGILQVATVLAAFFSGMLLPINVFPSWFGELARVLPWSTALQIPVDIYLEKYQGAELLQPLGFQLIWLVVLWVAGRLLTMLATRQVVVQGG